MPCGLFANINNDIWLMVHSGGWGEIQGMGGGGGVKIKMGLYSMGGGGGGNKWGYILEGVDGPFPAETLTCIHILTIVFPVDRVNS